ncbi:hypothetical protein ACJZ2D_015367 [Fusarium nematophilum]
MPSATRREKIQLVPWDPDSPEHIERLISHRVQCGWHEERVGPQWRGEQKAGEKCIYWITLSPDDPETEESLQLHLDLFPSERAPLIDTALSIRAQPRTPTQEAIYPVGHISLDADNVDAERLNIDLPTENVYWIKTFYVSKALRSKGIGRAAMDTVESMAINKPLLAKTLALDTVQKDDARRLAYEKTGQVPRTVNHEWYERRGYRLIHTEPNYYPADTVGAVPGIVTVFMRRDIA